MGRSPRDEQQLTTLRSRRPPTPPPIAHPARHHGEDELPPHTHTPPSRTPRNATRHKMPAPGKQPHLAVPRLSSPRCAVTRFRRRAEAPSALCRVMPGPSLAPTLSTAPLATLL